MKPVTEDVIQGKKRVATPLTSAPISKCARLMAADEKKAELKEKAAEREASRERKELSKAEKQSERERKAEEKKEKAEEREAKKKQREAEKAAKAAHPTKPRSAYFIFCASERDRIVEEAPELKGKVTEISKICGTRWKEISEDDKKSLETEAEAERLQYLAACEAAGIEPGKRYLTKEPKEAKEPKAKKEPKGAKRTPSDAAEVEAKDAGTEAA